MTTTKNTEAEQPRTARVYQRTVYAYRRVPTRGLQRILDAKLDGTAIRLWLALSAIANGHTRTVAISNTQLLQASKITDPKTLRTARGALVAARVLKATPADARREVYTYDLDQSKQPRQRGGRPGHGVMEHDWNDLLASLARPGGSWGEDE